MKIKNKTYSLILVFLFLAGVAGSGHYFRSGTSKAYNVTGKNIGKNHALLITDVCFVNKNSVQTLNRNSSYTNIAATNQANPFNNHSNLYLCPFIGSNTEKLNRNNSWFTTRLRT